MISFNEINHHWNYFLAIEKDLESLSRYIEFEARNLNTHSIELAHLLLSSSAEVDVMLKQYCKQLISNASPNNINEYKAIILSENSDILNQQILINRFGLVFTPFENWNNGNNPDWWRSYIQVKHNRNDYYHEANLQNTINSVGALLLVNVYYYKELFYNNGIIDEDSIIETKYKLNPSSSFVKLNSEFYYRNLVVKG